MAGAGREDEHVARADLEGLARGTAEDHGGAAGEDPEHLVGGAVEMMEVEDPAAPRARPPAVLGEQGFGLGRPRGT